MEPDELNDVYCYVDDIAGDVTNCLMGFLRSREDREGTRTKRVDLMTTNRKTLQICESRGKMTIWRSGST